MSEHVKVFEEHLLKARRLHVEQVWEGFEIILGWETRNKYRILDENRLPVAFAAEQSKGMGSALLRQVFGHWRPFKVFIFNERKEKLYELHFPFRWFFKALFVRDVSGRELGHMEQRFAIFRKKFDVYDRYGKVIARINSSFFRFWTFEFRFGPRKLGTVQKKWSGALSEFFTDRDNFVVSYADPNLDAETKTLMLSMCLLVDIVYFENNTGRFSLLDFMD